MQNSASDASFFGKNRNNSNERTFREKSMLADEISVLVHPNVVNAIDWSPLIGFASEVLDCLEGEI